MVSAHQLVVDINGRADVEPRLAAAERLRMGLDHVIARFGNDPLVPGLLERQPFVHGIAVGDDAAVETEDVVVGVGDVVEVVSGDEQGAAAADEVAE